ncbi:MAG: DNA primase [Ignavibacteriales bacterium]|nr:DNA primase [Ignavibacteriales bacterium]
MRIPQETIEQIRNATDIVEYIGSIVRLKKRGKDYLGLCPFHNEKTPSFSVSSSKQMFYCFGCHRGGDVVKFVMEHDKATYVEALEILAERAGIAITRTEEAYESASETERLYNAISFAARTFYNNLTKSTEGEFALDYFRKRGFTGQTITTFGLGYSLKSWDSLIAKAKEEGIPVETLEKVGLVRKRDDGTYYDAFRGRAMFPIFNTTGRVIAFGARKLYDDDNLGKYINSSETPIYHKSKVLYGLSQAKETIRQRDFVVMVEGYADLISVFQAGTKNIVASSGTALTTEQVQLISRYTKNITLVYDADSAGANAMMRGLDLVLEGGLDVRIVQLPSGEDPDSFVQKNGGDVFEEFLKKSVSFIDYKANEYQRAGKFDSPEGRTEAVRGLVQSIAKIPDQLKRTFFIKQVADTYNLYESTLYGELEKMTRRVPERFVATVRTEAEKEKSVEQPAAVPDELPLEERELFSAIFEDPREMIPFIFRDVQPSDFSHPVAQRIALTVLTYFDEHGEIEVNQILTMVENEKERAILADIAFNRYQLSERWNLIGSKMHESRLYEIALGAIKSLKKKKFEKELNDNRLQMKNASLTGADTMPFLKRQQEIIAKLQEIEAMRLMKG